MSETDALRVLADEDRTAVVRWLELLGLEEHELAAVPALRHMVELIACTRIVSDLHPPLSREKAWGIASEMLGLRDVLRRWYRVQARAAELEAARFCQETEPGGRFCDVEAA